jgi:hypothetical protein
MNETITIKIPAYELDNLKACLGVIYLALLKTDDGYRITPIPEFIREPLPMFFREQA